MVRQSCNNDFILVWAPGMEPEGLCSAVVTSTLTVCLCINYSTPMRRFPRSWNRQNTPSVLTPVGYWGWQGTPCFTGCSALKIESSVNIIVVNIKSISGYLNKLFLTHIFMKVTNAWKYTRYAFIVDIICYSCHNNVP